MTEAKTLTFGDTETTGLYTEGDGEGPHKIIECAFLKIAEDGLTIRHKFHYYLNPKRSVPAQAYKVHGISSSFLANKPLFKEIAADLLSFLKNETLVMHNAPFDVKFLNHELQALGLPTLQASGVKIIDTLKIAQNLYPGKKASLDALCERFKVDLSHRALHGALKDAELLAKVYYYLGAKNRHKQSSFELDKSTEQIKAINTICSKIKTKEASLSQEETKAHMEFVKQMQQSLWNDYKNL